MAKLMTVGGLWVSQRLNIDQLDSIGLSQFKDVNRFVTANLDRMFGYCLLDHSLVLGTIAPLI